MSLTAGAIAGIITGALVGLFYLVFCCMSVRKAIMDRRHIKARNKARRKAKEFYEKHKNPDLHKIEEAKGSVLTKDNVSSGQTSVGYNNHQNNYRRRSYDEDEDNFTAQIKAQLQVGGRGYDGARKISVISIDGMPAPPYHPTYMGGGGHIARQASSHHYHNAHHGPEALAMHGSSVPHPTTLYDNESSTRHTFHPPPERQVSPLSPVINNGTPSFDYGSDAGDFSSGRHLSNAPYPRMPQQPSKLTRGNSLKRRRSYEIAVDEEEGAVIVADSTDQDEMSSASLSTQKSKKKSHSRSVSRDSSLNRKSSSMSNYEFDRAQQQLLSNSSGRVSRESDRSGKAHLKDTTPRIQILKAYQAPQNNSKIQISPSSSSTSQEPLNFTGPATGRKPRHSSRPSQNNNSSALLSNMHYNDTENAF